MSRRLHRRQGGRFASDAKPWSPLALVPSVWFRADMGITMGTGVATWADQSGSGDANKNVTQATGTKQPTFTASDPGYNGYPTLGFSSAASQQLVSGTWASPVGTPDTIYIVGNNAGPGANQYYADGGATNQRAVFTNSTGDNVAALYAGATLISGVANSSAKAVIAGLFNSTTSKVWVSALTEKNTGDSGATGARNGLSLGAPYAGTGQWLDGKIAEVLIFPRTLTAAEHAAVMHYLGTRYGITIS